MQDRLRKGARLVAILALSGVVAACGLPRSGPYYEDLRYSQEQRDNVDPGFDLIPVTPEIVETINVAAPLGFSLNLIDAQPEKTAVLGVGDVVQITVWERGENGLFSPIGGATSLVSEIEESGNIYLPYVGDVRAAGRTAAGLRKRIRELLADKTLDPQVEVARKTGDSKSITITGTAGVAGVVPIERTTRSLLSLLAKTGFAVPDPEVIRVTVRRDGAEGSIWMRDLFENPEFDVPVRAGDVIFLNKDTRYFRSLGAVGQARVPFPTRDISVLDAIALVGGLQSSASDPSGVFVFRKESPAISEQISEFATPGEPRNIAYLLDLTEGSGMFLADQMLMRDGDVLYVTDAPFTRFQKVAGSVASIIGFAGTSAAAATIIP
ncbi:polysaccharide biosynthesis/export family protein [Pikeienuella sp. HZG-20]|uniref:polysaccharide biosynthesis/export family protein n=1 Tax=Paludibacillus litoralis TaxID=3133267 RepID=UPI0030EB2102